MKVSVVIPSYNARQQLRLLLLSLAHSQLDPPDSLEVVVVDDGSTDGTREMVGSYPAGLDLSYVFIPRSAASGRSAARNAGVAVANGDLVVLADADQVAPPSFVAEHVRYHRNFPDLVVVGLREDLGEGTIDEEMLAREFTFAALPEVIGRDDREQVFDEFSENYNNLATCWHHMFSCNASVRREHLLAVGGFDEGFRGWGLEDSELGYRLRQRGLAFAFNPAAVIYHQRGRGVTGDLYEQWLDNLSYFMSKYDSPEVASQAVIRRAFDPADRGITWLESMLRFEYAVRALAGRLPVPAPFELLEADEGNAAGVLEAVLQRAASTHLIVVDETARADLSGPVQCMGTDRELLYFHRPSSTVRDRILRRYQPRVVNW
jgi:glycosyltransferase involved in cell wall biosynthesis